VQEWETYAQAPPICDLRKKSAKCQTNRHRAKTTVLLFQSIKVRSQEDLPFIGDERAEFLEFPKIPHVLLKRIPRAFRLRAFAECLRQVISGGRVQDWKRLLQFPSCFWKPPWRHTLNMQVSAQRNLLRDITPAAWNMS